MTTPGVGDEPAGPVRQLADRGGGFEHFHGFLGVDSATPVSDDYGPKASKFTGKVRWVRIDLGDAAEDLDHRITPEERYRVAMTRQ